MMKKNYYFCDVKRRMLHIILSTMVIVAMLSGIVLQHHHHDADGSVCLTLCHCHEHQGDVDETCDDSDCALHLDTFCGDSHHIVSVQALAMAILPALQSLDPQEDTILLSDRADVPIRGLWHHTALKRRGPPADYYAC